MVPYGSPNRGLWRKSVFDTGEAGLGRNVNVCYIQEHPVGTEGPREINPDMLRYWRINPDAKNALGQPTGFDIKAVDYHKPVRSCHAIPHYDAGLFLTGWLCLCLSFIP